MAWNDFNNKAVLGTAPVEADGSAYFAVPADKFVYFQLLDENGMLVQSMRSGTIVRPGRAGAASAATSIGAPHAGLPVPLAMRRGPCRLAPWYGRHGTSAIPSKSNRYSTAIASRVTITARRRARNSTWRAT